MKVLPVVVLYNVNLLQCDSVNSLKNQDLNILSIDKIFVYDNSPDANINSGIGSYLNGLEVVYQHDTNNSGVSRAYNEAAKYASEKGYDWMLLLDQDTQLPAGSLEKYFQAVKAYDDLPVYAPVLRTKNNIICSPCKFKFHRGFTPKSTPSAGLANFKEYAPINSCMLVSTQKLISVGGYNEKAYLDFSDFQFIERLRSLYSQFYIVDFVALQDFSNDSSDVNALIKRFKIYCECARGCEKKSIIDNVQYFVVVSLRMLKLTIRTRSFSFFKTFTLSYICLRDKK